MDLLKVRKRFYLMSEKEAMNEITKICMIHSNDTHSYLDNFDRRAALIKEIRKQNQENQIDTLLLDSGDVFAGSIYFTMYHGKKEAELMNLLKYDVMTLGNHEFDRGSTILADFIKRLDFPVVATNIDLQQDPELKQFLPQKAKYQTRPAKILPFTIKRLSTGDQVGIFGLTTPTTVDSAAPSNKTIFNDPIKTAKKTVAHLQRLGVNKIILLSHLGDDEDIRLANLVSGIDIIVGGHTHKVIKEPIVINQPDGSKTIVTQVGQYGEYLGELQVSFNRQDGSLIAVNETIHSVNDYPKKDSRIKTMISKMEKEKSEVSSRVVGQTATVLNGERQALRVGDTNLGNLITDAFYYAAQKAGLRPDIAIMNSGGIRSSLSPGKIRFGDVVRVLPFSKELLVLEVTGAQLLESLEYGLFPQVSRLKLTYDLDKKVGNQLIESHIFTQKKLVTIEASKKYKVATNSFVGIGKDDYRGFKQARILLESGKLDVHLFSEYLDVLPKNMTYAENQRITYRNIDLKAPRLLD